MMGPEAAPMQEGKYGRNLAAKHPDWVADLVGAKIYQLATTMLRHLENDTNGRKINIRGTSAAECGSLTGIDGEGWESAHINDWFLAPKEGIFPHATISPFEVYEISMGINREQAPEKMKTRVGPSGEGSNTYSAINTMESAAEFIVRNMGEKKESGEIARI